jgi:Mg2+-importing ATPase
VSSIYDLLTFFVLLRVFRATPEAFHTGWFVESLATQTLVIFVIRTGGSAFASRPSPELAMSTIAVVAIGVSLPFVPPAARILGFTPLPAGFFAFLVLATVTYLAIVEAVKRSIMRRAFS